MNEKPSRPCVTMDVEVEFHYDVTDVLDRWTLDEVREFVEDQDEEGVQILREEGYNTEEDARWPSFGGTPLGAYLAWREAQVAAAPEPSEGSTA